MVSVANYPPPLTPRALDAAVQQITIQMLGLPLPNSDTDPAYSMVRVMRQQKGQPAQNIDTDRVYVWCAPVDDAYNRTRDKKNLYNDDVSIGQVTSYVRVWQVQWVLYGPNCVDNARIIKSALFEQDNHDLFATLPLGLALVTDVEEPRYVPEPREGGQWWERVDFEVKFNELVREVKILPTVVSTEIIVETDRFSTFFVDDYTVPGRNTFGAAYSSFVDGNFSTTLGVTPKNSPAPSFNGAILAGTPQVDTRLILICSNFIEVAYGSIGFYFRFVGADFSNIQQAYLVFLGGGPPNTIFVQKWAPGKTGVNLYVGPGPAVIPAGSVIKAELVGGLISVWLNDVLLFPPVMDFLPLASGAVGWVANVSSVSSFKLQLPLSIVADITANR